MDFEVSRVTIMTASDVVNNFWRLLYSWNQNIRTEKNEKTTTTTDLRKLNNRSSFFLGGSRMFYKIGGWSGIELKIIKLTAESRKKPEYYLEKHKLKSNPKILFGVRCRPNGTNKNLKSRKVNEIKKHIRISWRQ